MPVEYKRDPRTGKVVRVGSVGAGEGFVSATPPKPAAKPAAKPRQKSWWEKLTNDARYELNQLRANPQRTVQRLQQNVAALPGAYSRLEAQETIAGRARPYVLGPSLGIGADIVLGTVGAAANIGRNAIEAHQRFVQGKPKADYTTSPVASGIDAAEDFFYRGLERTPPSQMSPEQKSGADARSSGSLAILTALAGGAALQGLKGVAFVGPKAAALEQFLDPFKAKTLAGGATRLFMGAAADEALTTPLDDNTGGSAVSLVNAVLGTEFPDPVKPGMDRIDAAAAAFVPNTVFSFGLAGALSGGLNAVTRSRRGARTVQEQETRRKKLEDGGIEQSNPETGATAFTPAAVEPPAAPVDFRQAEADFLKQAGMPSREQIDGQAAAPAPEPAPAQVPSQEMAVGGPVMDPGAPLPSNSADKTEDIWDAQYDPSLPEADVGLAVVEQLDDEELPIAVQADNPVQAANDLIQQRPPLEVDPMARVDLAAAPSSALANPVVPFPSQWESLPTSQLKSVAAPENSPELFQRIQNLTGRDWEEFTKADVIEGLNLMAGDGMTVLPNRLIAGQQILPTGDIGVDPARFQFKQGVDTQGQQKGNSLSGVDRWNPDAEGVIQTWTDPLDGKPYVVNGHNRLAKAKELGIPSMRTEELLAATPEQARAMGAITNISSGGGTVFDAAKFLRDGGVTDPAQLEQLGIPMNSGFGGQGLALSRLPQNIFQSAVDGAIPLGKAVALGGSSLDEAGMQAAWKMLQGRDMTDATFSEVVQMGQSARTVEGDQVDLFGDTEQLNTMVQKAELAAKVRADLIGDKNLFGRVGRNAGKLQAGGNVIDATGSQDVAARAQALIGTFDAEKYADGTVISELLNEGAAQLAQGGKAAVIARRIKQQLVAAAEQAPVPEVPRVEAPVEQAPVEPRAMTPDERAAMQLAAVQKAAANGHVRPSTTPIPAIPRDSGVNIEKAAKDLEAGQITDDVVQLLDDELRLRREHEELDAAMQRAQAQENRDAIGYDELTFEQKKALGMTEGFTAPATPSIAPAIEIPDGASRKITAKTSESRILGAAESLSGWTKLPGKEPMSREKALEIVRAKGAILSPDSIPGLDMDAARNDNSMGRATPATEAVASAYRQFYGLDGGSPLPATPSIAPGFTLPKELSNAAPRYGMGTLAFESDLDRAAYILARDADGKPSKSAAKFRAALQAAGINVDDVVRHGREKVQPAVKRAAGGGAAPTSAVQIAVPGQGFSGGSPLRATMQGSTGPRPGAGIPSRLVDEWLFEKPDGWAAAAARQLMTTKKPKDFTKREAFLVDFAAEVRDFRGEQNFRKAWLDGLEQSVDKKAALAEKDNLEGWLSTYNERSAKSLARTATNELMDALREGIRVSGISPERIKVLDQIAMVDQFGADTAFQSQQAWDPARARLLDQRPYSDAAKFMDSRIAGLRVPVQFPGPLQDSILLSLELQLSKAFGLGRSASGVRGRSMVGDAYHESFHRLQEFLFPSEKAVLETPEAKAEMVALIQKGRGTYEPGMDIAEIQAEAFAVWSLRRYEARNGSIVQQVFSQLSELVNTVGAAIRNIRGKAPTVVDIFEDAWGGQTITARAEKVLQGLPNSDLLRVAGDVDEQLNKLRPDIAQRVRAEIDRRYAQVEAGLDDWNNRNRQEGC
jgi:hypothetical protein